MYFLTTFGVYEINPHRWVVAHNLELFAFKHKQSVRNQLIHRFFCLRIKHSSNAKREIIRPGNLSFQILSPAPDNGSCTERHFHLMPFFVKPITRRVKCTLYIGLCAEIARINLFSIFYQVCHFFKKRFYKIFHCIGICSP